MINPDTLTWLTKCPASDSGFNNALFDANAATCRAALDSPLSEAAGHLIGVRLARIERGLLVADPGGPVFARFLALADLPLLEAIRSRIPLSEIERTDAVIARQIDLTARALEAARALTTDPLPPTQEPAMTDEISAPAVSPMEPDPYAGLPQVGDLIHAPAPVGAQPGDGDKLDALRAVPMRWTVLPDEEGAPTSEQAAVLEAMEALKTIGRMEMAEFIATVSDRVIADSYLKIKESGGWRLVPYRNEAGRVETVSTLDEFCQRFLKRSYRRCQQLVANLHLLGPALYEQAEQIGLRQRDYDALKALPGEDQALIKAAIEAEDRSRVIDLLQEMAVKHGKEKKAHADEKAALEKSLADKDATIGAARQLADKAAQELRELKEANLRKELGALDQADLDKAAQELRGAAEGLYANILASLRAKCLKVLDSHTGPSEASGRLLVAQALGLIHSGADQVAKALEIVPATGAEQALEQATVKPGDKAWAAYRAELAAQAGGSEG